MREKLEVSVLTEPDEKDRVNWSAALLRAVSAMGIAAGMTGLFLAAGGLWEATLPVLAAVLSAALMAGLGLATKGQSYGTPLCGLAAVVLFFSSGSSVARGIYRWTDHFLGIWDQAFSTFYEGIAVSGYRPEDLQMAGIVFALFSSLAVSELIRRKRLALLSLAVFMPLCVGMLLSMRLPIWACVCLVAGWLGAWCSVSGPAQVRWETAALTAGTVVFLLSVSSLSPGPRWQEISWRSRTRMEQEIERLRFGEDTLPKGDLTKADRMLNGTEDRLEVEMGEASALYLRGFVGSVYRGNRWEYFTSDVFRGEYRGMLTWLAQQRFYPGAQYGLYQELTWQEDGEPAATAVSVRNVGADRRYLYLPDTVASYPEDGGSWQQDRSMGALGWSGKKDYAFTCYPVQENAEAQPPGQWNGQDLSDIELFEQAEGVYRAFVYENYLEIGDEQKALIDRVFFQQDALEKAEGLYPVTSRIRAISRLLAGYEEVPARLPAGRDLLQWFLNEEKKGNAVYFATAAVLAYRAAGIPARYVEGYVLTRQQAEEAEGDTVTLTGKNAHAWAEVYVDGAGWRAVEVTPGFYEETYQADVIVAVPDESLEGAGGEAASILTAEEYQPLEQEEEDMATGQTGDRTRWRLSIWLLSLLGALLLLGDLSLLEQLLLGWRYRRMDERAKMFYLYGRIMDRMGMLYKGFDPDQPLKGFGGGEGADGPAAVPFDLDLYERTVKRMEKIVYGQMEPAVREVPSTEALARQLETALKQKRRSLWRIRPIWRKGRNGSV